MIEFSLSIDLGRKERIEPSADGSMPIDRGFVAQSLVTLATKIRAGNDTHGAVLDDTGIEVGNWKFGLLPFED